MKQTINRKKSKNLVLVSLMIFLPSLACQFLSDLVTDGFQPTNAAPGGERISATPTIEPVISARDDMPLIFIPAGEFIMGTDDGELNEKPLQTVYLDSYWIDQTEVTNEMYLKCISAGICEAPTADGFYAPTNHYTLPENAKSPVVYVSWTDASTYCAWVDRRLPTEAEWEKAARGTSGQTYPWGDQPANTELLNFDNEIGKPVAVGSFPAGASPYGVLDMAGNAWEYVQDWYAEDYYLYAPSNNPPGPSSGVNRSVRGGGFFSQSYEVRASFRNPAGPEYKLGSDFGFRCATDHTAQP